MNAIISFRLLQKFFFAGLFAGLIFSTAIAADTNSSAARLVIVKATYGDPGDASATEDVTKQVAAAVNDNSVELRVDGNIFEDPASGVNKVLKVNYTIDGIAGTKAVWENGLLRLSLKDKPDSTKKASTRLIIRKAIYGNLPDGDQNDVTADVAAMVKDDSLTVTANSDDFGDPAAGSSKKLQVDYAFDGKEKSKIVGEGETLKISTVGE